jgi:hypothetical protein
MFIFLSANNPKDCLRRLNNFRPEIDKKTNQPVIERHVAAAMETAKQLGHI